MKQYTWRHFVNRNQLYADKEFLFDLPFDLPLQLSACPAPALCPPCTTISPWDLWLGPGSGAGTGAGLEKSTFQPSRSLPRPPASQNHRARCRAMVVPLGIEFTPTIQQDNKRREIHQSHISLTPFYKPDNT